MKHTLPCDESATTGCLLCVRIWKASHDSLSSSWQPTLHHVCLQVWFSPSTPALTIPLFQPSHRGCNWLVCSEKCIVGASFWLSRLLHHAAWSAPSSCRQADAGSSITIRAWGKVWSDHLFHQIGCETRIVVPVTIGTRLNKRRVMCQTPHPTAFNCLQVSCIVQACGSQGSGAAFTGIDGVVSSDTWPLIGESYWTSSATQCDDMGLQNLIRARPTPCP